MILRLWRELQAKPVFKVCAQNALQRTAQPDLCRLCAFFWSKSYKTLKNFIQQYT